MPYSRSTMPGRPLAIDAHQHFWSYDPAEYPWIQPEWPIRRDFLPADLWPLLEKSGFNGCVAVQARQTVAETEWLLGLARKFPFIFGVVGWVDLRSAGIERDLDQFVNESKLVGVRHVVQDEPDDEFMLGPEFQRGIAALRDRDLTYDLLVFPKQLPAAIKLARKFPEQPFVLDHIAKPPIKQRQLEPWRTDLRELARSRNVFCKISGMVTEAAWQTWRPADFRPFLEVVWEAFGEDRLMLGSDWPVCLLSADYKSTIDMAFDFLAQFGPDTRRKVLGANAKRFYGLTTD